MKNKYRYSMAAITIKRENCTSCTTCWSTSRKYVKKTLQMV